MLTAVMSSLTRLSPAKINLTLRVAGTRPDGYHGIESLVARVMLCDTVAIAPRDDGQRTLRCDDPRLPADERNLALQAVQRLAQAAGVERGVHVAIEKRIPAGAGLGGGSSNAASVLMLLNELWELAMSEEELARIGVRIGSDVPLFFSSPVCIIRGRGERIERVHQRLSANVLLLLPDVHCATQAVYSAWDSLAVPPARPPLAEIVPRLDSPERLATLLFNDLEEAAFAVRPELRTLADDLRQLCGRPAHMTGSGSAMFCLADPGAEWLMAAEQKVRTSGLPVRTVRVSVEP
jgi:4-diphosphocytidyl-2-C-methyl-D-erythritol kinase